MDVQPSASAGARARYRVSELPPDHFATLDDDTLGALASRSALHQVPWTPDVAAAVTERVAREALAYPEQFAREGQLEGSAAGQRPVASPVRIAEPRVRHRRGRGLGLALAGVLAVVAVVGGSLYLEHGLPSLLPDAGPATQPAEHALEARSEAVEGHLEPATKSAIEPTLAAAARRGEMAGHALAIVAARPLPNGRIGARVRLEGVPAGIADGVRRTELLRKVRDGGWQHVASVDGAGSIETTLVPDKRYDFRVRTLDESGDLIALRRVRAVLTVRNWASERVRRTPGDWTTTTGDPQLGGALASRTADASIRTSFRGDGVALVAPVGPDWGAMRIRVDDGEWVRGDLSEPQPAERAVVFRRILENGVHSMDIGVADGAITLEAMLIVRVPEAWSRPS